MNRKAFLQKLSLGAAGVLLTTHFSRCVSDKQQNIQFVLSGANAKVGHLLREKISDEVAIHHTEKHKIFIIGAGISGLSAGYFLQKKGISDFKIIELDNTIGGNSQSGKNADSAYPYGAHYLPIPHSENQDLLDFLTEKKIITAYNAENLPFYDEQMLCFSPEERLLIDHYWQEGIVPNLHLTANDQKEMARFFALIEELKQAKGEDGKYVFQVPLAMASEKNEWLQWDKISFKDYLTQENYTSEKLLWYVNYACRDDYGQGIDKISAYAGLHYFASRKGKGANCEENAVLTWAEGNGHLAHLLAETLTHQIATGQFVRKINITSNMCSAIVYDVQKEVHYRIEAEKVILAVPYFVRQKLLAEIENLVLPFEIAHQPWLVTTITLKDFTDKRGFPLAWDNVLMHSETLGFVNAQHQSLKTQHEHQVFTLYKPLDKTSPSEARKEYYGKTEMALQQEVIADLKAYFPQIESQILAIDCHLWGHGMVSPGIHFLSHPAKKQLRFPIQKKIFFAHSDYSGISIFEEAFWQGKKAVAELLMNE